MIAAGLALQIKTKPREATSTPATPQVASA